MLRPITIRQEHGKTGRHYLVKGYEFAVPATIGYHPMVLSFPYDIELIGGKYTDLAANIGDKFDFQINPDTSVGTLTNEVSTGTTMVVSQSVLDVLDVGYIITIAGYTSKVAAINGDTLTLTLVETIAETLTAASNVDMTICMAEGIALNGIDANDEVRGSIMSQLIPAGTQFVCNYYNSTAIAKTFHFMLEHFY